MLRGNLVDNKETIPYRYSIPLAHILDWHMADTLVWISGATAGVGSGLARTVPYPGARIINLSRHPHPDFESVQFDLTEPSTYAAVRDSFEKELADFRGKRAVFFHNAY
jgi:benzil reductase ((S)-benzoin forming)